MRFLPAIFTLAAFFTPALATLALAACPANTTPILSCTFADGAKVLDACQDGVTASYAFGKAGRAPDLTLSTPIRDLAFRPWPGIGRSIWANVSFENQDVTYLLWYNWDKVNAIEEAQAAGAPDPLSAGIVVLRGEEELARLDCDPGSIITQMDAVFEAKEGQGMCFDFASHAWAACE